MTRFYHEIRHYDVITELIKIKIWWDSAPGSLDCSMKLRIIPSCPPLQGYYMYIETSSPRQQGDNAKLNSPKLQFSGSMCLKFYYHMYGANIATLNVIIKGNNVFTASGNKGNKWLRAAIDVSLSGKHAVRDIIMPLGRCIVYPNC